MESAILFESRTTILATVQHNWQCISWLYIGSTKQFHVRGYANVSKQDRRIPVHSYMPPASPCVSNKVKVILIVYCALLGQSHNRCDRIGSKIERALIPYQPISIGPVYLSELTHFTIGRRTRQSAGSARANRIV